MKSILKPILTLFLISFFFSVTCLASDKGTMAMDKAMMDMMMTMENQSIAESNRIGNLINESVVDGYFLSYYFKDLRENQNKDNGHSTGSMSADPKAGQNDKPHHIMVYITDKNHAPVLTGKVGFLIKDSQGNRQKYMGMMMNDGFGTTADMKEKGVYKIMTKVVLADKQFMNSFEYKIR